MMLKEYLKNNRFSVVQFAALINYDRSSIHEIIKGRRKAGKKLIKTIMKFTNGEVSEEEILIPYKERMQNTEK